MDVDFKKRMLSESKYNFDKIADYYDNYHNIHQHFLDFIKKNSALHSNSNIVDIGCGTGAETHNIFLTIRCNTYGVEPSENMMKKCQEKTNEIHWITGTAEDTQLKDSYFDVITSFFSIHHFSDINRAAQEFYRILKPSGRVYIFTISHKQMENSLEYLFFPKLLEFDRKRIPDLPYLKKILSLNGFKAKFKDIEYETRNIDEYYIEKVRNNYRTAFFLLSEKEKYEGISLVEKCISKNTNLVDKVECTVIVCEKDIN